MAGWSKVKTYMGREDNLKIKWISEKHILGILKGNIFVIIKIDFMEEVELGRDSGEVNSQGVKMRVWQHIGEKYST